MVETGGLENRCGGNSTGGSNPSPSANLSHSDSIVVAMRRDRKTVEYIVFPDEGHPFARPENRLVSYATAYHHSGRETRARAT